MKITRAAVRHVVDFPGDPLGVEGRVELGEELGGGSGDEEAGRRVGIEVAVLHPAGGGGAVALEEENCLWRRRVVKDVKGEGDVSGKQFQGVERGSADEVGW